MGLHADYLSDKRGIQTMCFRKGWGGGGQGATPGDHQSKSWLIMVRCPQGFFFFPLSFQRKRWSLADLKSSSDRVGELKGLVDFTCPHLCYPLILTVSLER